MPGRPSRKVLPSRSLTEGGLPPEHYSSRSAEGQATEVALARAREFLTGGVASPGDVRGLAVSTAVDVMRHSSNDAVRVGAAKVAGELADNMAAVQATVSPQLLASYDEEISRAMLLALRSSSRSQLERASAIARKLTR